MMLARSTVIAGSVQHDGSLSQSMGDVYYCGKTSF
jgi:hypothetical protein